MPGDKKSLQVGRAFLEYAEHLALLNEVRVEVRDKIEHTTRVTKQLVKDMNDGNMVSANHQLRYLGDLPDLLVKGELYQRCTEKAKRAIEEEAGKEVSGVLVE